MKLVVDNSIAGERFDVIASGLLPDLSRNYVTTLIKAGSIQLNDRSEKPGYKLKKNEIIEVKVDLDNLKNIPDIDLPIIYEDTDVIVIDKPDGVISHSRGRYWYEPSVASFIRQKVSNKDNESNDRMGIVHRLDRVTSGVMICAKHVEALKSLQLQFNKRTVDKTYIAIVEGHMKQRTAVIDMPIERNPKKPSIFRAGPNGKPSQTMYEVMSSTQNHDKLMLKPKTGRTHQLRVHLSQVGHPIVGDHLYGTDSDRLYLHAAELSIVLPGNSKKTTFKSALPKEFKSLLQNDS